MTETGELLRYDGALRASQDDQDKVWNTTCLPNRCLMLLYLKKTGLQLEAYYPPGTVDTPADVTGYLTSFISKYIAKDSSGPQGG